jgi:hypothetical protein
MITESMQVTFVIAAITTTLPTSPLLDRFGRP